MAPLYGVRQQADAGPPLPGEQQGGEQALAAPVIQSLLDARLEGQFPHFRGQPERVQFPPGQSVGQHQQAAAVQPHAGGQAVAPSCLQPVHDRGKLAPMGAFRQFSHFQNL
jgi:hypothetical protein